jgi:BCCT family betaine/carnitine transporter
MKLFRLFDAKLAIPPIIFIIIITLTFGYYPTQSSEILGYLRNQLGNNLGSYYILIGFIFFVTSIYIAFSKIGKIQLGQSKSPRYKDFTWAAMIFTGTMAADIIYFSLVEWAYYKNETYIIDKGFQEFGMTYSLFHWGPIPWSFYVIIAISFSFFIFVKGIKKIRFSEICRPLLKDKTDGIWGRLIDITTIIVLLAGTSTTFSIATPMMTQILGNLFSISVSSQLTVIVLIFIAFIYGITVMFGYKGISIMSRVATLLFMLLLTYVFVFGNSTIYIFETGIESIGNLLNNSISMALTTDPLRAHEFAQNWTIFYWAYWMAWCVATPIFIAVISEGRTIKNTILGIYLYGLSGTYLSFIILGGYGMNQSVLGNIILNNSGSLDNPYELVLDILDSLPFASLAMFVLIIIMALFYSTTFDSITQVVSSITTKSNFDSSQEPPKPIKIIWAALFILIPIVLVFNNESLTSLQSFSIIGAFPIGIIFVLVLFSFLKEAGSYVDSIKK